MSWYNTQGPLGDHVLYSRVRYIRNIAKQSFYHLIDPKRSADATAKLDSILTKNGFHSESVAPGVSAQILSLAEKQFVTRDFVYSDKPRALYLNEPCNMIVSLGGDNYVSISSVVSGAAIAEARNMAAGAEELIDREIAFAYLEGIGYLSPNPADCGSGLELSACIYLPSLRASGSFSSLARSLSLIGISLSPIFDGQENAGDLYVMSYIPHYLSDEGAATRFFADTLSSLVEKEKARLGIISKNDDNNIFDRARRSLGALVYCAAISEREMLSLISDIRLCLCTCAVNEGDLPSLQTLNYLSCEGLSASIVASAKEKCLTEKDADKARAAFISSYIEHKKEVKNVK